METKIIKVVFGGRRYAVTNKRTRTDYGQTLEFVDIALPETFEVIFSNSATSAGTGKKMIGSNQRCLIPDGMGACTRWRGRWTAYVQH